MAVGAVLSLVGVLSAGLVVIEDGLFPATAITPHDPVTSWATHTAMIRAVRRDAAAEAAQAVSAITPAEVAQGFRLYDQHCVMCHGGPGIARAGWTAGLTPAPPYLLDASRRWSPGELRVIVGDGIKMTAMPAWRLTLGEGDVLSLVAFLEALPYISPERYRQLRGGGRTLIAYERGAPTVHTTYSGVAPVDTWTAEASPARFFKFRWTATSTAF